MSKHIPLVVNFVNSWMSSILGFSILVMATHQMVQAIHLGLTTLDVLQTSFNEELEIRRCAAKKAALKNLQDATSSLLMAYPQPIFQNPHHDLEFHCLTQGSKIKALIQHEWNNQIPTHWPNWNYALSLP